MKKSSGIQMICPECTVEQHSTWQANNKNTKIKIGGFIKVSLTGSAGTENMWIKVTEIDGDRITGNLDSHPVVLGKKLKFGEKLTVSRMAIMSYIE